MTVIRSAAAEDAARLLEIYGYYVRDTAVSFEIDVPDAEEFRRRIEHTLERDPYLVAEEDGAVLGYAYAGTFKARAAYDHCREVTVYLDKDARGRGLGRALYGALERELKKRGVTNLYACIASPVKEDEYLTNASENFHRRMGYVLAGTFHRCGFKFGRFYDMIWMEKLIGAAAEPENGGASAP